ncbi:MAG: hypothetical protein JSS66_10475 [Armatimonadetes bacterium]|nr:hypothetical protein [Armatimonadota bacterium]
MTRTSPITALLVLALSAGCSKGPPAPYPVLAEPDPAYRPPNGSTNAFDKYVALAQRALDKCPDEAERVTFSDAMAKQTLAKIGALLPTLAASTRFPCDYHYAVTDPFAPEAPTKGWRLLGRGLSWKIEDAIQHADWPAVVDWTLVATKFGLDLLQGDAQTASLGLAVCDDARKAIAPALEKIPAGQLLRLEQGLRTRLSKFPGLKAMVRNEGHRMLLGAQFVQDCRRDAKYEDLQSALGKDSRPAVTYLRDLSEKERPSFFECFVQELKDFAGHWEAEVDKPRPERAVWKPATENRPWKRFAKAFSGGLEPVLLACDTTLAKTRILALTARAEAGTRVSGAAPQGIQGLPESMTLDPFSGKSLFYFATGPDYRVYSVGLDGVDNGGNSDEAGETPDVVLESPSL